MKDKFKDHFRAFLIDFDLDKEEIISRIIKSFRHEITMPWMISEQKISNFKKVHARLIENRTFYVERMDLEYSREYCKRFIQVIQPNDFNSCSNLCFDKSIDNRYRGDTLIVIPENSSLDNLENILKRREIQDNYIPFFDEIISQFDWFYEIGGDRTQDTQYSLLFSRNSDLLQKFNSMTLDDGYELISCF